LVQARRLEPPDAALLLCGFDPDRLKGAGIRLDGRELPEEFTEASKVYRILKSGANGGQQTIPSMPSNTRSARACPVRADPNLSHPAD